MKLRGKLLAFVLAYSALSTALIIVFAFFTVRQILIADASARAGAMLIGFDRFRPVLEGLVSRDEKSLSQPIKMLMAGGAFQATVLSRDGRVIASSDEAEVGKMYSDAHSLERLSRETPEVRKTFVRGRRVVKATLPVWSPSGAELGAVQVVVSLESSLRTTWRISFKLLGIILVIIGAGSAVLLFGLQAILRPIFGLTAATERIAAGRLGELVPVESADELGTLSQRFNEMSLRLNETTVSKDYLDAILDHVFDCIVVTDFHGTIRFLNPTAKAALGGAEGDWLGHPARSLFVRHSVRDVARAANGRAVTGEALLAARSGDVPVLFSIARFEERGGRKGLAFSFRDITRFTRAQRQLASANTELAQANRRIEDFVRVAAHDLQEPLRRIVNHGELLARPRQGGDVEDARRSIQFMVDGAMRVKAVVSGLLAYSAIGREGAQPERVDLNSAFDSVCRQLEPEISAVCARITRDDLPNVLIRRRHATELFWHLLKNAIAFRSPSSPRIHASCRPDSDFYVLSVRDNGVGIPAEYLSSAFEPFRRIRGKDDYKGAGVGLAICRRIVELSGGTIWAESKVGVGSVFSFSLPRA